MLGRALPATAQSLRKKLMFLFPGTTQIHICFTTPGK